MKRRTVIGLAALSVVSVAAGYTLLPQASRRRGNSGFEIEKTDREWRALLSEEQYLVLREEQTERPNTSPLLNEKRAGTYHCAACDLALYDSSQKYDSGTGWPSFKAAVANAVGTRPDETLFVPRTEVHCRRCGGHLGHIFDDGPPPTGKRHCINGLSLVFRAA